MHLALQSTILASARLTLARVRVSLDKDAHIDSGRSIENVDPLTTSNSGPAFARCSKQLLR